MVASHRHGGHRISLQRAWEPPTTVESGWRRRFGRPADVPAGERIDLVIVGPGPVVESATLNGRPIAWADLATAGSMIVCGRLDVTGMLDRRNELRIVAGVASIGGDSSDAVRGTLPEGVAMVWLEIHPPPPPASSPTYHP